MNKLKAQAELYNGKRLTHEYFAKGEYIRMEKNSLLDERGITLDKKEFWLHREAPIFDEGWFEYPIESIWFETDEVPAELEGIELIGVSKKWVDPDCNPTGYRLCFFNEFKKKEWHSVRYSYNQDTYIDVEPEEDDKPEFVHMLPIFEK